MCLPRPEKKQSVTRSVVYILALYCTALAGKRHCAHVPFSDRRLVYENDLRSLKYVSILHHAGRKGKVKRTLEIELRKVWHITTILLKKMFYLI